MLVTSLINFSLCITIKDPPRSLCVIIKDPPKFPRALNEHKRAKRWTALLFSSSKLKPSELPLRKDAPW